MKIKILPFICLFFSLVSFAQENQITQSQNKGESNGTVYFYRVKEVTGIDNRNSKVNLNGVKAFEMKQAKWIGINLAHGKYILSMRQKQAEMLLKVEAGKTYFVRVSEKTGGFTYNQSLTLVDEEQAVFQMRELLVLERKKVFVKDSDIITEKPVENVP